MGNITKRQIKQLLRRVQRFQLVDGGRHNVGIHVYERDTKGTFWFTCMGEPNYYAACYDWRTYEDNLDEISKFIDLINNN